MKSHASMNRIYRLVWNVALNLWVAVAENAKGRSKGGRAGSSRSSVEFSSAISESSGGSGGSGGFLLSAPCRAALMMFSAFGYLGLFAPVVQAEPSGGVVSAGSGSIGQSGAATTINQASQRLAIDWNRFSTAAHESVVFVQPNAQAIALNRVIGSTPSTLLGSLTANGQVFVLNPNGVLFGAGSQVNVGGLVASTLNMSNADFMAGNHVFTNSGGTGSVMNQGTLTAAQGGYIALLAPDVRNEGVISATLGTALLAAGNKVTLNLNNGSLLGFSIDEGALNALADNKQLIQADGGQVLMSARAANALSAATVNNTGVIEAKTLLNQNGVIKLIGDMQFGQANVAGRLDASAPNGGDGGFIETSAARVQVADGTVVSTLAAAGTGGKNGLWLIDPIDFTVAASGGNISGANVSSNLNTTPFKVQSTSGNVIVNDQISWSQNKLTLSALGSIFLNKNLNGSGSASLALEYGQCASECGFGATYNIGAGVKINLPAGLNFTTQSGSSAIKSYTVVTSLGVVNDIGNSSLQGIKNNLSGLYVLGADIDAAATSSPAWLASGGFNPIGTSVSAFTGDLDGLGHTISNLTINRPTTDDVGLFGAKSGTSTLQNLTLTGVNVKGRDRTGALVGHDNSYLSTGRLVNVHSYGSVTGASDTGGLVGLLQGGSVKFSDANGEVTGTGTNTGGLIGRTNYNTSLVFDNFFGSVSGVNVVGGLVGYNTAAIGSSFTNGSTVTGSDSVGGLAGYNSGTITGSSSGLAVMGTSAVGGLVGYNGGAGTGTIQGNSNATGEVTGTESVGGLVGFQSGSGVTTSSQASGNVHGVGSSANVGGLVGENEGQVSYSGATGTVNGVDNVGGLVGGNFGTGQVFGSNTSSNVSGTNSVGGLVGFQASNASAESVSASGNVTGAVAGINTGGLIGYNEGSIDAAFATGSVLGGSNTGGLVGKNAGAGSISDSYALGATGGVAAIGGLVGLNQGDVSTNYALGNVNGQNKVGGLVGENQGSISGASSNGNVMGPTNIGGLVGENTLGASINESYASGNVNGTTAVGGLVGKNAGEIADTYATGNVTGSQQVGGLVGNHFGTGTLASSYATGLVSGVESATTHGLIGTGIGAVSDSYWDTETTGQSLSGTIATGAYGLTTAQMMDSSYLGGLGFSQGCGPTVSDKWWLSEGNTRPFLRIEYSRNIRNAHQLQLIALNPGASYTLANNIDLSELSRPAGMWNINKGFVPLGDSDTPFTGELYGQGYTIDGLKINRPAMTDVGLFGVTGEGSYITSLVLTNVDVNGGENTGALVGRATAGYDYNDIDQVQVDGAVVGGVSTGGLVGQSEGAYIYASSFNGVVTGSTNTGGLVGNNSGSIEQSTASGTVSGIVKNGYDGDNVGGLVGYNSGFILYSSASSTVTGQSSVGGLVGYNDSVGGYSNRSSGVNIDNSNASGEVSGTYSVGGLVGYQASGAGVAEVFAIGNVTSTGDNAGGLVGYNFGVVDQSYATGNVNGGGEYTGGLVGNNDPDGSITKSYATGQVTGTEAVGGLVGHNYGLVSESYATGQVTGSTGVGGLAGENGGTITLSHATGNVYGIVIGSNDPYVIGGLVGSNTYGASIETSYATGIVDSGPDGLKTGGLVGFNAGSIENSYASGSVVGGQYNGGLAGYNTGSIGFAYATGSVSGSENTGGLVGYNETYATIDNVYATGFVDGGAGISTSGLIGQNNGDVTAAYWDKSTTGQSGGGSPGATGLNAGQMFSSFNMGGFDFTSDGAWWQSEGNTRPFLRSEYRNIISNAHELQLIAMNTSSGYVVANNIDLAEINSASGMWNPAKGFVPLGDSTNPFTGTFDGVGYTISNLAINRPLENGVGLFGVQVGNVSRIENILLTDAVVVGGLGTGALVGRSTNATTISNVQSSNGNVFGAGDTGGLVGRADRAGIFYAYSDGNVTGTAANTGGLVGATTADTAIFDSGFFGGTVSGLANTGGLVGHNAGDIERTFAYGTVMGAAKTGGLVGENNSSIINSFSNSIVSGLSSVGGLAGLNSGDISNSYTSSSGTATATSRGAGGLVGTNSGTLDTVYATNRVYGVDATGGLVGENLGGGTIVDTYSTGAVTATGSGTGGLVGVNGGSVDTSYSVGQVLSAGTNTGGLVGQNTGGVTSSYWNVTTSGQAGSAGGTGKTSAQLLTLSAFSGFDIDDAGATSKTWRIYEGNTNPLLRDFLTRFSLDNKSVVYNGTTQQGFDPGSTPRTLIVASGRNAGNYSAYSDQQGYDISGGKLVIAKADLALTTSDVNKTYNGGLDASGTAVATGGTQVFGDDTLSGGTFAFVNKNAGVNKTVTISGVTVDDSNGGGNYNVTYVDNLTSSISAANLVLTTSDVVKTYNGAFDALGTATATGGTQVFAGDVLSGGTFAFTDKNAGPGNKTVTTSGVTIDDGNSGGNYNVSYVDNTTSTINKALLTVTAGQVTKGYDGTTTASGTAAVGTLAGQLAGESVASAGSQAFLDKNFGIGNKTVRASGVTIKDSGNLDVTGNYAITYADNTTSTINKALLTVTAGQVTKGYDGTTTATGTAAVGTLAGQLAGESVASAGSQAFLDKNAGTGNKVVRASGVTIKDSGNLDVTGNYAITYADNTSSTINKALLTVTAGQVSKTYDGTTAASGTAAVGTLAGAAASESVASAGSQAFLDKNAGTGNKVVRASGVTIKDSGNLDVTGNYAITYADNTSSTINKALLSVTAGQVTKGYDGTTTATGTAAVGTLAGQLAGESVASAGSQAFLDKNAGTGNKVVRASGVTIKDSGNLDVTGNYAITYADNTSSTINKALLTVTAGQVSKTYDGTTAASGTAAVGTLAGAAASESVASAGSQAFLDKNAGTGNKVVRASGVTIKDSGNLDVTGNYAITYADNTSSTINKALLTVTAGQVSKTYDGTTAASGTAAVGTLAGAAASESVASAGSQAFLDKNAGTGNKVVRASGVTIKDSGNLDVTGNYAITYADNTSSTINKALLSVTAGQVTKGYDGTTTATGTAAVGTLAGQLAGESVASAGSQAFLDKNAGTGNKVVRASGVTIKDSGNLDVTGNYAITYADNTSSTINKALLTVTAGQVSKTYDGTTAASGTAAVGTLAGAAASESVASAGSQAFLDKNAGTGNKVVRASGVTIKDSGNLDVTGNYAITYADNTSSTINKALLSVTAGQVTKGYDGTTTATGTAAVGTLAGQLAGESVASAGSQAFLDKNAGTGNKVVRASGVTIKDSGNLDVTGNYAITYADNTSSTINKALLTVTAGQVSKTYDGTTAASGTAAVGTLAGAAASESVASAGSQAFLDKNAGTGNKVVRASGVTIKDSGNLDVTGNYAITYADNTSSTINKALLSVTAGQVTKGYDGTTTATGTAAVGTLAGQLAGESVASAGSQAFLDKNAGTGNKVVRASGVTIKDSGNLDVTGNYAITYADNTSSTINKALLSVTAGQVTKGYDGTTTATGTAAVGTLAGQLAGESVASAGSQAFLDKNAGTGNKVVRASGVTIKDSGNLDVTGNYAITYADNTSSTINKALLSVTAGQVSKTYDGTTTATGTAAVGTLAGQLAGESVASAGSQAFLDKNAGTGNKVVRASGVTIKDSGNLDVTGNYAITYADNTSSTINKALLTVTAGQVSKTYDGTTAASGTAAVGTLAGAAASESVASAGSQAFLDKNAGTGNKVVRASGVTIKDSGNLDVTGNYAITYADNTSSTINKALLTVTAGQVSKTYDGTTAASGTAAVGTLAGAAASESVASAGSQAFLDKNAGTGNKVVRASGVTIKDSGNLDVTGNYAITYADNTTSTINKALLTVTAGQVTKGYDGTTTASGAGTAGTLAGQLAGESVASAGSQAFLDKNAGTGNKVVRASGVTIKDSGNLDVTGNYNISYVDNTTSTINKAALTIGASGVNKVYDGTLGATVNYNDSRFGNDNIIVSGSASYIDKNVATGKTVNVTGISVTGNDASNYTFLTTSATTSADITKRALTIGGTGTDKVYDGTTTSGAVTLNDNRISGDVLTVSSTGASFADKNAGIGKAVNLTGVSVIGADAGNYSFGTTGVATATITPRALSVSAAGLDKVYDGTAAASVFYVDNRLAGDSFTVAGSASFADKNVARGNVFGGTVVTTTDANGNSISKVVIGNTIGVVNKAINVSGINLAGLDANNYTSNATAVTAAKITPKTLTVSASGVDKIYDGSAAASAALSDNRATGDALTTSYAAASFGDKNVGTAKTVNVSGISVSGADFANYSYSGSATAVTSASITPKALNVTATGTDKVYDGNTVGAVTLADNRVAGDALSVVNAAANFTDKNAGIGKTVNVTGISVTGSDVANYTFNTAAVATASITPKALGYSVTASGKEYDGNTSAVAAVSGLTGLVGSETVSVASNSATFNSKNVATANRVTVNSATLADGTGLASNYSIAGGGSAAASITARALTVTASGINKTYDGNASASVSYSDNRIGGDVLTVGGSASYLDKNAGTGKTVNVNGITLSGQDATNYLLAGNTATTAADIARRALAVSATGVDKVYDGLTGATVSYTDNRVAGDALSVAGSANYLDKNAGTSKAVNVTGITLGSTDANNYTVNTSAATTASITPKALSYNTAASGKVYDGNTNATATVSGLAGFVGTETVGVAGNTATFNSKDVAAANLVTVNSITLANGANGGLAGNYQIAAGGTAAAGISAKALSYTTAAVSKVYDGTASGTATLNGLTGLVGTETVTAIANATFNSKDVGVANQVTVNSIALSNGANGGLATNYSVAAGGTAAAGITAKALGYSTTALDKVYDGNTAATASLSLTGLVGTETVNVASTSASFDSKDVATANLVTVNSATLANGNNGGLASNYSIAGGGTAAARINAKLLTYDTAAASKVYDGSVSAVAGLSIVANGLVNNETVTATGSASFNSKDVATANLVTVNSAALVDGMNGGMASNYRINAGGTAAAAITRRGLDIAATGVNKVYDGTTVATAVLSDNRVAGDTLTGTYSSASYTDKNVAAGKVVNVSGIAIGGLDANNYTPTNTSAVTSASITPRALTVSATGVNKVYDGTTVASAALSDNRVANDSLTASYSSATYLDKNVANGKTVNVSGINVAGNDAINYTFNTSAVTSANITPRALSISASGVNKVYDGTTAAVVGYTDNRVAGDVLSIAGNASFVDKNAGSAKTVNVSGITLGNADAINYTFNGSAVTSASITPKALSVAANNDSRFFTGIGYSGGNGVVYSGLVAGETSAVLAGSLSYGGSSQGAVASGAYSINPAGLSSGNYTIAYTNGVLNIGAASAGSAALGGPGLVPAYDSVLAGLPGSSGQGQGDGQSGSNGTNGNNGTNGLNGGNGSGGQPGGSLAQIQGCGVSLPPGANTTSCQ